MICRPLQGISSWEEDEEVESCFSYRIYIHCKRKSFDKACRLQNAVKKTERSNTLEVRDKKSDEKVSAPPMTDHFESDFCEDSGPPCTP